MPGFFDDKRREIDDRLAELRPIVAEYERLLNASEALASIPTSTNGTSSSRPRGVRRGPGRPRGSKNKTGRSPNTTSSIATKSTGKPAVKSRVGRPRGSGKYGAEALATIQRKPGITFIELSKEIDTDKSYLRRVLRALEKENKITRDGHSWHPAK